MDMSTAPLLVALEAWLENRLLTLHTNLPGIVESYDGHDKRTATILPAINFKIPRGPTLKHGPIPNVPVIFPSSNGFQMLFDIKPGDGVLLVFSEASMGNWMDGAGQVDPEDSTRFSMHDAIAIPGLWSTSKVPRLPSDGDFVLASSTGARMGGTSEGTLDLANEVTNLRAELDKLHDTIKAIREDLVTGLTNLAGVATSPAALVPVGLGTPLSLAFTAEAARNLAAQAEIAVNKAFLGKLLK